jgi:hypothetical protein
MTTIKKAFVVEPDGTNYIQHFEQAPLRILQGIVEGLIEPIEITRGLTLWVNEEGKLTGKTPNKVATAFYQRKFGAVDIVVGTVVFTGGTDEEGETLGLTDETIQLLQRVTDKVLGDATPEQLEAWQNEVKERAQL